METTTTRPFLKWAGGKEQLLGKLERLWPSTIDRYFEPFVGSGAVFFRLSHQLQTARINDVNPLLVELYRYVRDEPQGLISELQSLSREGCNTAETFYERRELFNSLMAEEASLLRSALMIYLNKTCYNGLFRVNSKGLFNVPFGRYTRPRVLDPDRLLAASAALGRVDRISNLDFGEFLLSEAREGDFVYLDPPYAPVSMTSNFTSYARSSFGVEEQRRLADTLARLHEQGVQWMLSNSCTPFTKKVFVSELFTRLGLPKRRPWVNRIEARRSINSKSSSRGPVLEYVIRNYR